MCWMVSKHQLKKITITLLVYPIDLLTREDEPAIQGLLSHFSPSSERISVQCSDYCETDFLLLGEVFSSTLQCLEASLEREQRAKAALRVATGSSELSICSASSVAFVGFFYGGIWSLLSVLVMTNSFFFVFLSLIGLNYYIDKK